MSAADLKTKGNAEFSAGNFEQAIQYFSDAIVLEPVNEVLYCNRSMAYASLGNWEQAITDAKTVRHV
jgi:stress-induced-phosphoprotein 1